MALTWRGSAVSPYIEAVPPLNGNVVSFAIVNTFRSRAKINILRAIMQIDPGNSPAGSTSNRVMPIIRARRCAASDVSGGIEIKTRGPFDTTLNVPDPGVKILYSPGSMGTPETMIQAANRGTPLWEQFTSRTVSEAEQRTTWDNTCVPGLAASKDFVINIGEAVIFEQASALPTGGYTFFQALWEEDTTDAGYTIGGSVSLSGSPVNGAKVLLVTDSNADLPSPELEILTTGVPGTFSKIVASGVKASVFVQHQNGGTKYTDEGKPYIENS